MSIVHSRREFIKLSVASATAAEASLDPRKVNTWPAAMSALARTTHVIQAMAFIVV